MEIKRKAEKDLEKFKEVGQMKLMSGKYFETEYVLSEGNTPSLRDTPLQEGNTPRPILRMGSPSPSMKGWTPKADGVVAEVSLTVEEWIELKKRLQRELGGDIGEISKLQEDENRFYVIAILEKEIDKIRVATVEWKKVPFEDWWEEKKFEENSFTELDFSFTLPSINFSSCTDDTWQSTFVGTTPSERDLHTAVWADSEMIVWGGDYPRTSIGGRHCACTIPSAFILITPSNNGQLA